jgi:hypothetical protein
MPGWDSPVRPAVYKAPIGAQVASPQSPILRWSTSRISALPLRTRWAKQKSGFANYSCPVLLAPRHERKQGQGCSPVLPVEGRTMPAPLKSEDRNPNPEGGPKSEVREWLEPMCCCFAEEDLDAEFLSAHPRPARRSNRRGQ